MRQLYLAVAATVIAGGAAVAGDSVRLTDVGKPLTWGAATSVVHVRQLWLGGQPDEPALQTAKQSGIGVVINLRDPAELSWDEKTAAESLGLIYYDVPIAKDGPFAAEQFEKVTALVEQHAGTEVLIHCSTGNRAAAWFGANVVAKHGMTAEAALALARAAGLNKPEAIERLREHLHSGQAPSPAGPNR